MANDPSTSSDTAQQRTQPLRAAEAELSVNDPVNIGIDHGFELLSNFGATPFELDGVQFESVESFVQYIKYPTDIEAVVTSKEQIRKLHGVEAKRAGKEANIAINMQIAKDGGSFVNVKVYWKGEEIPYRSQQHMELVQRALTAKFEYNQEARAQLLATGNRLLIHNLGHPESANSSLPALEFCRMLTEIRAALVPPPAI